MVLDNFLLINFFDIRNAHIFQIDFFNKIYNSIPKNFIQFLC